MTIPKSKIVVAILFIIIAGCSCTNIDYKEPIKVLSVKPATRNSYVSYLDNELELKSTINYNSDMIGFIADESVDYYDDKIFAIASDGKNQKLESINLINGLIQNIIDGNGADSKVVVDDYLFFYKQSANDNLFKYSLKEKKIEKSVVENDFLFEIMTYNNRLFAIRDVMSEAGAFDSYLVEYNVDDLSEISSKKIERNSTYIRPIINDDRIYYSDYDGKSIIIEGLNDNFKKVIKPDSEYAQYFKIYDDKLYIINKSDLVFRADDKYKASSEVIIYDINDYSSSELKANEPILDIMIKDDYIYLLHSESISLYTKEFEFVKETTNKIDEEGFYNFSFIG
jgi:hypothetical protein